jgi:hypothetical protein
MVISTTEQFMLERVDSLLGMALNAVDLAKEEKQWTASICLPADLTEWELQLLCSLVPYATLVEETALWIQLG